MTNAQRQMIADHLRRTASLVRLDDPDTAELLGFTAAAIEGGHEADTIRCLKAWTKAAREFRKNGA